MTLLYYCYLLRKRIDDFMSARYKMPPPARYAVNTVLRLCGQRRRRKFPPQRGPPRLLVVCEDCGFSSRHRVIVARHWRFCRPTPSGPRFSCDRCAWTSDTAATYADHRRTAHGNRVIITYVPHVELSMYVLGVILTSLLSRASWTYPRIA